MALFIWMMGILAIGSQAAQMTFNPSIPVSCDPLSVTIQGTNATGSNLTMNFLLFGDVPLSIPFDHVHNKDSKLHLNVSFLPLAPGTSFIAYIGGLPLNVTPISSITTAGKGTRNCTLTPASNSPGPFTVANQDNNNPVFDKCKNISVVWTPPAQPPNITLFHNGGPAVTLNQSLSDPSRYEMGHIPGKIALLFEDHGNKQVSYLSTIVGDDNSKCSSMKNEKQKKKQPKPSGIVIGAAIAGGIVLFIGIAMVLYLLRERRRKRELKFVPEKVGGFRLGPPPPAEGFTEAFVRNPPYTMEGFSSPVKSEHTLRTSWGQKIPEDQRWPGTADEHPAENNRVDHNRSGSVESLDVEAMLNLAAHQSNRSSSRTSEPTPFGSSYSSLPPAAHLRPGSANKLSVPLIVVDGSFAEEGQRVQNRPPGLPRSPRMHDSSQPSV